MKLETSPFRACLLADWRDALFVHYAIDPAILQPHVPFDLDLFEGEAWVTLVAFTQVRLRPALGGRFTAWSMRPVATHAFLNLRTYVRCPGRRAIYFLVEWIPNRLARLVGPRLYGLPFRLGRLDYTEDTRRVCAGGQSLCVRVADAGHNPSSTCESTRDHFLVERYTAFTCRGACARRFDIRHEPWRLAPVEVTIDTDALVRQAAPWFAHARYVCAHTSAGVEDVEMSAPRKVPLPRRSSHTQKSAWAAMLPPILFPLLALALRGRLPAWGFMWALAFALYFGCKLATWMAVRPRVGGWGRNLAYLFAWAGMDPRGFLAGAAPVERSRSDVAAAGGRMFAGMILFFVLAPVVPSGHALLLGWIGLAGMLLLLHFGLFDLLALAWQSAGRCALPIMRAPWRARSLGEFWGTRWNRGFRDLAHAWIFTPLRKLVGAGAATFAVFLISGLVHDLVISLPARAGFGGPTLYFLLQFLGIAVEKSPFGRRFLRRRSGRLFTFASVVAPLPLLFHAPFVTRVMAPFMRAISPI